MALALLFYIRHRPLATGFALGRRLWSSFTPSPFSPPFIDGATGAVGDAGRRGREIAAGYACYSSVGIHVLGFLPEYAKEEGLASGSRYFCSPSPATPCTGRRCLPAHFTPLPPCCIGVIAVGLVDQRGRAAHCDSLLIRFGGRPRCCFPPTIPGTTCGYCPLSA